MKVLKGILEEQLENAIQLKKDYNREISNLRHGAIIKKSVYNHDYYYQEYRNGPQIIFKYLGKLEPNQINEFLEEKHRREEYIKMVKELDMQIRFLKKALKAKEMRNV